MGGGGKDRERKGLAFLEQLFFTDGAEAVRQAMVRISPSFLAQPYAIMKTGSGQKTVRTGADESDQIEYESYNPPSIWGAPYAVHLVTFQPAPKKDFMHHVGEELLTPVAGQVTYHFYWTPGSSLPQHIELKPPLKVGKIARINPQIPHHTWAAGNEKSIAWMIFRDLSGSPAAISLGPVLDNQTQPKSLRVTEETLRDKPGIYALIAWGLAEKIRIARQRANITSAELAQLVGVDASYIYRVENADTNLSTDKLLSIASVLNISLQGFVDSGSWNYEIDSLKDKGKGISPQQVLCKPSSLPHFLHPHVLNIAKDNTIRARSLESEYEDEYSTWIMLEGECLVKIEQEDQSSDEILTKGGVLHFRQGLPLSIRALSSVQLLQIACSRVCGCKK
jgi:transcriptional regulator with XRE-family HTH domain